MSAILAALLTAAPVPAAAASTTTAVAPTTAAVTPIGQFKGRNECQCLKDKFCWSLVLTGFSEILNMRFSEIEAALPNRFFPNSLASTLSAMDANGDFLRVTCGPSRAPCDGNRDELEKRVIYSAFFEALPERSKARPTFDRETWAITDDGEDVMKKAKKCRPGLMGELMVVLKRRLRGGPK